MAIENRIGKVKSNKKGYLMDFNAGKIAMAITEAAQEVGGLERNIDPDSIYIRFKGESEEAIARALTEDVILCLNMQREHRSPHLPPTLEDIHDVVIDVLQDRGFESVSSSYSIYKEGQKAIRMGWIHEKQSVGNGFPKDSVKKRRQWCGKQGITNTADLNAQIASGKMRDLVCADSQRYEHELQQAVKKFATEKQKRDLRVMIVAGPSSSGKSTTAKKLCTYLQAKGYKFKLLQVDNYFFAASEYPRDWFGDMNYELPESIDLLRLNADLGRLLHGDKIFPPTYDFKSGLRLESESPFQLKKDEILLLDCLHGLYPPATHTVPAACKFKVYIETYPGIDNQQGHAIKFTDIRLLRRMCRDVRDRGYSVQYTLQHWAAVRKGEFKGIIPFYRTADVRINGGLVYDLPVLKNCLLDCCGGALDDEMLQMYKKRGRMDVWRRGSRIKKLLDEIRMPSPEEIAAIPADNLIREFIGLTVPGSSLQQAD